METGAAKSAWNVLHLRTGNARCIADGIDWLSLQAPVPALGMASGGSLASLGPVWKRWSIVKGRSLAGGEWLVAVEHGRSCHVVAQSFVTGWSLRPLEIAMRHWTTAEIKPFLRRPPEAQALAKMGNKMSSSSTRSARHFNLVSALSRL
jgi:hypothetical protein